MKSAMFVLLSATLHAAVLLYPVSFGRPTLTDLIEVTILPMGDEAGGANGQPGSRNQTFPRAEQSRPAKPSFKPRAVLEAPPKAEPKPLPANNVAVASDGNIEWGSAIARSTDTVTDAISSVAAEDPKSNANGRGQTGSGNGPGGTGMGTGYGNGNGVGSGSLGTSVSLTQARYRDTPRPDYPDSARREGREGRVLLRVFVDDQGRSTQVEIKRSSGTEALDKAAAEAIKRWHFHPARNGDQPIESWVSIPIDFRLVDDKNQPSNERR